MPERTILQADALVWMRENAAGPGTSVITSLPDVSELQLSLSAWRTWFVDAARAVLRWVPETGLAIFYQSDIRHEGIIVDKSYLVMRAAEEEQAGLVWHKIVCRSPPGSIALGRPSYSHMLCFARTLRRPPQRPGPDVLPEPGERSWTRGMGSTTCRVACAFLRDETDTRVVVDPFCGHGMVLAVANSMGFDAIGVEISAKRCRTARKLTL